MPLIVRQQPDYLHLGQVNKKRIIAVTSLFVFKLILNSVLLVYNRKKKHNIPLSNSYLNFVLSTQTLLLYYIAVEISWFELWMELYFLFYFKLPDYKHFPFAMVISSSIEIISREHVTSEQKLTSFEFQWKLFHKIHHL